MASLELIANEIRALRAHYPNRAMAVEAEARWLQDYAEALGVFTDRQVTEGCRRWRLGEERKMPGVRQLVDLAKASLPTLMTAPTRNPTEEWSPNSISDGEYADMTLRQKARERRLQACHEEVQASTHRQRHKPESEQSETYAFHRRQAQSHHLEAARLVNMAKEGGIPL